MKTPQEKVLSKLHDLQLHARLEGNVRAAIVECCEILNSSLSFQDEVNTNTAKTVPEKVFATHPRTGDKIVNVTDNVIGIRADLIKPDGKRLPLIGTWVFAPDLSFHTLFSDDKVGDVTGYVLIGNAWQY